MPPIDTKNLDKEIKIFLKTTEPMCDGDKELQHDIDVYLNHLALCYQAGDHVETFEYTAAIDTLKELSELNNIESYDLLIRDFPHIQNLLSFYQKKISRRKLK